ncbi:unnamed protein product [Nippostrongylus brasiliensis]|uniref:Uncharacterized protein n=1 Tax=Nippostrongylus brasiliensis TaxID=27835 RepID=A0A0N4YU56_NIPBR|nr:unnamed protein product [Nippostrongylus brasiliensis]
MDPISLPSTASYSSTEHRKLTRENGHEHPVLLNDVNPSEEPLEEVADV